MSAHSRVCDNKGEDWRDGMFPLLTDFSGVGEENGVQALQRLVNKADELLSCGHMEVSGAWLPRQSMEAVTLRLVPSFSSLQNTWYPM